MELRIQSLISDESCYEVVRKMRWGAGVKCPHCEAKDIVRRGRDEQEKGRQRYECKGCGKRFDDLTNTVFAGHHQSLKVWMIFLYFMGLNLSTRQIAQELNLNKDDAQRMAEILRSGVVERKPETALSGEVECDEVYVVAGHKGQPEAVKKRTGRAGAIG
jgi:transposase-like protein